MSDGFHTTCTTCSSRLRVKDPSLAGEILSCPKCGGMVLIVPPEGYTPPVADAAAIDPAITESQLADGGSELQDAASLEPHPADFAPGTTTGWYPLAFAGVGTLLAAVAFGWFSFQQRNTPSASGSNPESLVARSDTEENLIDPMPEEVPEASSVSDETVDPVVDSEQNVAPRSPDEQVDLVAEEVDPFDEVESAESELSENTISNQITPEVTSDSIVDNDSLHRLASLLGGGPDAPANPTSASNESDDVQFQPSNETNRIDVKAMANQSIHEVRFERVPLIDFLRSMTQLTNVPVRLDALAIELSGHVATVPVSVVKREASLLEILQAAVTPLRLRPVLSARSITITSERLQNESLVVHQFFVGDLLAEDFDCAHFVATLVDPQSWVAGGGDGSILIEGDNLRLKNTNRVAAQVAFLLERLRQARSLPTQETLPSHLTQTTMRWRSLSQKLQQTIDVRVWGESTLVDIVSEIEQRADLRILVDWESLGAYGIAPQREARLYIQDKSVEFAVGELMAAQHVNKGEFELYPVDAETVLLTTNDAAPVRSPFVDFYQFDRLTAANQAVVEQLMLHGHAAIDPPSGAVVVGARSHVHRALSRPR